MRRALFVLALGLALAAPRLALAQASGSQAQLVYHMTAHLSGASETPGVLTGAYGMADITVNLATQTVTYTVQVFNMPSGTTAGHFHVGGAGLAGPVVVDIAPPVGASNEFTVSGTATASSLRVRADQGIRSWDDFLQALVGGQVYLNIHSTVNPGGEIRGQVTVVP
ncbi:MAG: CHRD domain-containing protein [Vicinamibacterales bacterium]